MANLPRNSNNLGFTKGELGLGHYMHFFYSYVPKIGQGQIERIDPPQQGKVIWVARGILGRVEYQSSNAAGPQERME